MPKNASYNQHYVPRLLLRGFTRRPKNQLFVYDKHTDKIFNTVPENIAAEKNFYEIEVEGQLISVDPSLDILDGEAAKIINRIRETENLSLLTQEEKSHLAVFVAVQFLRVKQRREILQDLSDQLDRRIKEFAEKLNATSDFQPFSSEEVKTISLQMVVEHSTILAKILLGYIWLLLKTSPSNPFIISDHPVTLSSQKDFGIYGNLGFAVPGIEVSMPISDSLSLLFLSESYIESIELTKTKIGRNLLFAQSRGMNSLLGNEIETYRGLDGKGPFPIPKKTVIWHNSQQILYAGRWIFSPVDDFTLVKKMINDDPNVRRGLVMTISGFGKRSRRKTN